jgi:hypothetical protein
MFGTKKLIIISLIKKGSFARQNKQIYEFLIPFILSKSSYFGSKSDIIINGYFVGRNMYGSLIEAVNFNLFLHTLCEPSLSVYDSIALVDLGGFFSFDSLVVGTASRKAAVYTQNRTTQTQNKRTQKSMLRVGIELTILVFEGAKTVHALKHSATRPNI